LAQPAVFKQMTPRLVAFAPGGCGNFEAVVLVTEMAGGSADYPFSDPANAITDLI